MLEMIRKLLDEKYSVRNVTLAHANRLRPRFGLSLERLLTMILIDLRSPTRARNLHSNLVGTFPLQKSCRRP